MKKLFKLVSSSLILCLVISIFTACSKGGSDQSTSSGKEQANSTQKSSGQKTKLVVWGGVDENMGPKDVCNEFMKNNPDITVEYVRYVNDDQGNLKLDTNLMSGNDIDVYFTYFDDMITKRVGGGVAEDLGPWLKKDNFNMDENYGDQYFKYKDKVYSIPTAKEFQYVYANEDMFKEAGIKLPESWTLDEYVDITKKLTKNDGSVKRYGGLLEWDNLCKYLVHTPKLGANSFYKEDGTSNFDNSVFKESLQFMTKLMLQDKSHVNLIEYQTSKMTPYGELLNQKTATAAGGLWITRMIKDTSNYPHNFKVAILPFPQVEKGQPNYGWPGLNNHIMMNANSKNKEAAYKLLKYWGTEGQMYMARAGKLPSWKKINQDEVLQKMLGDQADKLFDVEIAKKTIFNGNEKMFVNTQTAGYSQLVKVWKEEVEKALGGNEDIDTALKNAKKRADDGIKSASK